MIKHPTMTTKEIVDVMQSGTHEPPRAIGRPESDSARAAADAALREIVADPNNIRGVCVGCGANYPVLTMAMCVCGSPVCAECQRVEEDGVCLHERPDGIPDDDDA